MRPARKPSATPKMRSWSRIAVVIGVVLVLFYALWGFRSLKTNSSSSSSSSSARPSPAPSTKTLPSSSVPSEQASTVAPHAAMQEQYRLNKLAHTIFLNKGRTEEGLPSLQAAAGSASLDDGVVHKLEAAPEPSSSGSSSDAGSRASPAGTADQGGPEVSSGAGAGGGAGIPTEDSSAHREDDSSSGSSRSSSSSSSSSSSGITEASTSSGVDYALSRKGRSSGSQLTRQIEGGTLLSWGLKEWRLGRVHGEASVPEPALADLKVTSIAGSRHAAIATAEGHVWTMGHDDSKGGGGHGSIPMLVSGQLGRPGGSMPARVLGELEGKFVVQVSTGRYHTLALTDDGAVYSWGLNDWGQLGRKGEIGTLMPLKANAPPDQQREWDAVQGRQGEECTHGPACHQTRPGLVSQLAGKRIVGISSGRYNTLALDDRGVLHVWGLDGCGSGGMVPARETAWMARPAGGGLEGQQVTAFDSGYVLWIAATATGEVYTCNSQDDGYGGTLVQKHAANHAGELGRTTDPFLPGKVAGPLAGQFVVSVAAGREHSLATTAEGRVFSWGGRRDVAGRGGQLSVPGLVGGDLAEDKIKMVAAGEYFSLAASEHHVYGWGGTGYKCTGQAPSNPKVSGSTIDVPARADGPTADGSWRILSLAAGFQHAMAIGIPEDSSALASASTAPSSSFGGASVQENQQQLQLEQQRREQQEQEQQQPRLDEQQRKEQQEQEQQPQQQEKEQQQRQQEAEQLRQQEEQQQQQQQQQQLDAWSQQKAVQPQQQGVLPQLPEQEVKQQQQQPWVQPQQEQQLQPQQQEEVKQQPWQQPGVQPQQQQGDLPQQQQQEVQQQQQQQPGVQPQQQQGDLPQQEQQEVQQQQQQQQQPGVQPQQQQGNLPQQQQQEVQQLQGLLPQQGAQLQQQQQQQQQGGLSQPQQVVQPQGQLQQQQEGVSQPQQQQQQQQQQPQQSEPQPEQQQEAVQPQQEQQQQQQQPQQSEPQLEQQQEAVQPQPQQEQQQQQQQLKPEPQPGQQQEAVQPQQQQLNLEPQPGQQQQAAWLAHDPEAAQRAHQLQEMQQQLGIMAAEQSRPAAGTVAQQQQELPQQQQDLQKQQQQPQGQEVQPQGQEVQPQGQEVQPQGQEVQPQGQEVQPQGQEVQPQGQEVQPQGQEVQQQQQQQQQQLGLQQGQASQPQQQQLGASGPQAVAVPGSGGPAEGEPKDGFHSIYAYAQVHPPTTHVADVWENHKRLPNYEAIRAESPDIFDFMPATLERKFKNPCWYKDGKLICVPYYQILGVSKCGTTDLYHRLSQHPQVFKAANKGPHWWDECAYGKPCAPVPPDGDFASYTRLFDDAARSIETQDPNGITGEASSNTYTAAMGVYLRGASWGRNTNVTMPQLLWEASPWLRSIIIFRDPVERYTSAFYYYRHNKGNNQELHATAVRDIESWHRCVASHGTPWCVRHYNPQQLVKGMYAEFMDDWLKHFPREQLLILRYEDYTRAQVNHLDALFKFLGLNDLQELPEGKRSSITTMPVRNKNSDKYDKMLPETRKLMQEFYAPFNAKLASILKDDRFLWTPEPDSESNPSQQAPQQQQQQQQAQVQPQQMLPTRRMLRYQRKTL